MGVGGNIADIKKEVKLTAFEKELIESIKKVNEFKEACEANIVSILYKSPELLYENNLSLNEFTNNIWKVYFQIVYDIVVLEKKNVLDDITIGLYLEKHSKLKCKYDEYGGYDTISKATTYVKVENLDGYISELRKWNAVFLLGKSGFPINSRISDFCDMTAEEIYDEYEALLNHTFVNVDQDVKVFNACENLHELIDKLNEGKSVGMPFYNCPILNKEISGLNMNGNIYGLGASSGVGKSTTAINYIVPSILNYDEKVVFIINEEDETKIQRELLIWVANNVFKANIHKYILRDGKFSDEILQVLRKSADWLEQKKKNKNITIIPLEKYNVKKVIKIIKKYSKAFGVSLFVLDTLKESSDSRNVETWKSMERDMVDLYDIVKPTSCNVCLFVTYQLGKSSIKQRYLTNNEIGQSKSIVDVMSVNLMMRKPFDDEYEGGNKELTCYKLEGKNSKIPFKLKRDKYYMIMFIPKNRFGATDEFQIVSEYDFSLNIYHDIGICNVSQDW